MRALAGLMRTVPWTVLTVARLLAAVPLLGYGATHLGEPLEFRKVLENSRLPFYSPSMFEASVIAVPVVECLAGGLLLLGLFSRVGGFLGVSTMIPAIWATVVIQALPERGQPSIPHILIPIGVLTACFFCIVLGGGRYSLDRAFTTPRRHL